MWLVVTIIILLIILGVSSFVLGRFFDGSISAGAVATGVLSIVALLIAHFWLGISPSTLFGLTYSLVKLVGGIAIPILAGVIVVAGVVIHFFGE